MGGTIVIEELEKALAYSEAQLEIAREMGNKRDIERYEIYVRSVKDDIAIEKAKQFAKERAAESTEFLLDFLGNERRS